MKNKPLSTISNFHHLKTKLAKITTILSIGMAVSACQPPQEINKEVTAEPTQLTVEDAKKFVLDAEKSLDASYEMIGKAFWVQANFVTEDTNALAAKASEESTIEGVRLAVAAQKFDHLELDYDTRRKLDMLKMGLTLPAPSDKKKTEELSKLTSQLDATYAKGCTAAGECYSLGDLSGTLANSNDPNEMLEAWLIGAKFLLRCVKAINAW